MNSEIYRLEKLHGIEKTKEEVIGNGSVKHKFVKYLKMN